MQHPEQNANLKVRAIAGTHVVTIGIDLVNEAGAFTTDLLGFAIEREDRTEGEKYWLSGMKTFYSTGKGIPPGTPVSLRDHPLQSFQWGDYTAKPGHEYVYRVVCMRGTPKSLRESEDIRVPVTTETEDGGTHEVYFNRGVAASQAYAREFGNVHPDNVPNNRAWEWLSRGLEEAILRFIGQAQRGQALHGAFYEFHYDPVLEEFGKAAERGVDVHLIVDMKQNGGEESPDGFPRADNLAGIARTRLQARGVEVVRREANPSYIAHNKFCVLSDAGGPRCVWTGSTNISKGGIFGQSNVGHVVKNTEVARSYRRYWDLLRPDHAAIELRPALDESFPFVAPDLLRSGMMTVFSPHGDFGPLDWYAKLLDKAERIACITFAFSIDDRFASVLEKDEADLKFVIVESDSKSGIPRFRKNRNTLVAAGQVIGDKGYAQFMRGERLVAKLNTHVKYIHEKFLLVDPLGPMPLLVTGSANFSEGSTNSNDENMLVVIGDTRVADIYFGEFMRLFNHFYVRYWIHQLEAKDDDDPTKGHLIESEKWLQKYFSGGPKQLQRQYFAEQT
jgi:phosphatidylserine/phosphatidylglycerophosphate/cardiolipin synthase-like enzyme